MQNVLLTAQIVLAVLIVIAILLQAQGTGFGASWQGGGETYHTKRGLEKMIFYFTILAVALFTIVAIAGFVV